MVTDKKTKYQEDIIDDVLRRVTDVMPGFNETLSEQIAHDVRHEWAGATTRICYIARREDDVRSRRNEAIIRDYLSGERIALLQRRYHLTARRILQIIKSK